MNEIQSISQWAEDLYSESLLKLILPALLIDDYSLVDIKSYKEYDDIYRLQHDTVLMTLKNDLRFKLDETILEFLQKNSLDIKLDEKNEILTPDILILKDGVIFMGELTISTRPKEAFVSKKTKYSYLIYQLQKKIKVDYKVTVFSSFGDVYMDEIGFPGVCVEIIRRFQNLLISLRLRHPEFESIRQRSHDYITDFSQIAIKPEIDVDPDLTSSDNIFLENLTDFIIKNTRKIFPKKEKLSFEEIDDNIHSLRKEYLQNLPNPEDHKAILKIPFYKSNIRRNRNTISDSQEILELLPIINRIFSSNAIEDKDDKHLYNIRLSKEKHVEIAIEGPGAKKYMPDEERIKRRNRQKNFIFNPDMDFSEINSFLASANQSIDSVSPKDRQEFESRNMMCRYLEELELISREISLNAMRRNRKKRFVISPTDVEGVYIILYPGPMLRASEVNSTVWVKILSNKEILFPSLSCRFSHASNWTHTRWLSFTSKKLDHYLRSKDQVLMAYYSHLSLSDQIEISILNDYSDTLSLMTLIWAEDLRQTSTTLHDFRYFIMQKLSINPDYRKLSSKVLIPFRSPILYLCVRRLFEFLDSKTEYEDALLEDAEMMGASLKSQRVITRGPGLLNFQQLINEAYFSMLFNKNEQEPANDSLQILEKILEAEEDFQYSKQLGLVDVDGWDVDKLSKIMLEDHPGAYSSQAILIGSKLQLKSYHNKVGLAATEISSERSSINKFIEEFATLKSSSIANEENVRSKCINQCINLLNNGLSKSFDVAEAYLKKPIEVQLFKKNQIGGVREISILDIASRIKTNIVESYFRGLDSFDDREMLTKGSQKFDYMREFNKDTIGKTKFYVNGDATRWAQSFHPHQFKYLIAPHTTPLKGYIQHIFQQFTEKKMYVPKRLKDLWLKYPNEEKGTSTRLNSLKTEYLKQRSDELKAGISIEQIKPTIPNESNMCQGILHYTSSYLHCCLMSFIEAILSKISILFKLNLKMDCLVSSDDFLIMLMTDIKQSRKLIRTLTGEEEKRAIERIKKLNLCYMFLQSTMIYCQRLFNVHNSSKTSITNTVYEFNSCFALKFSFLTPIIKFAIASTEPINTDSPARMVAEGVNRVNQIIENGGSMELAKISHEFNKRYVQEITNLYEVNLPTEVGVYPDPLNASELYMFGHKFHDFLLVKNYDLLTEIEKQTLSSVLRTQFTDSVEMASNLLHKDVLQIGKIILATAPSKKWLNLIKSLPYSREELNQRLIDDPLIIFKNKPTLDDQKIRCSLKAYTSNVREALRNTSASIYYARYSAYRTANAFNVMGSSKLTFPQALEKLRCDKLPQEILQKRFSDYKDMLVVSGLDKKVDLILLEPRPKFQSKKLLNLRVLTNVNHIKSPILKLINFRWTNWEPEPGDIGQYNRDWEILKLRVPQLSDTLSETIYRIKEEFKLTEDESVAFLIKTINNNMKETSISRKTFSYGLSTVNLIDTFRTLQFENQYANLRLKNYDQEIKMIEYLEMTPIISIYDLFMAYSNIPSLKTFLQVAQIGSKTLWEELSLNYHRIYYSYDDAFNRRKLLVMLIHLGIINSDQFIQLMEDQRVILRQWIKPQINVNGNWQGDCLVVYYSRKSVLMVRFYQQAQRFEFSFKKGPIWEQDVGLCFKQFLMDFKTSYNEVLGKSLPGNYSFNDNPATIFSSKGFLMIEDYRLSYEFTNFQIRREKYSVAIFDDRGDILKTYISINPVHMYYTIPETKTKLFVNGFNLLRLLRHQFLLESFQIEKVGDIGSDYDEETIVSSVEPTLIVSALLRHLGILFNEKTPEEKEAMVITEEKIVGNEEFDRFYDDLLNIQADDMKDFIQPLFQNMETDSYENLMEITDEMKSFINNLLQPNYMREERILHYLDPRRLDKLPYAYYKEFKLKIDYTPIQIFSLLKNEKDGSFWKIQLLIYLANSKIKDNKIPGVYDPNIRLEEQTENISFEL